MNKFWKVLGITALAAAVPLKIRKDEETGRKKYQSLLLCADVGPGENGEGTDIDIHAEGGILTGLIADRVIAKKEAKLFADDDPEAAVVGAETAADPETDVPAPSPAEDAVTEDDFDPDL